MGSPARVALIADDDDLFRVGLRLLLTSKLNFSEVLEAASLDDAVEMLGADPRVEFAAFDLSMPGMQSAASLKGVRQIRPDVRVVVVSGSRSRHDVLLALESGVHGYIAKSDGLPEIEKALHHVFAGLIYVPSFVATLDFEATTKPAASPGPLSVPLDKLTPRQRDVVSLLREGKSNKEIGRTLGLAEGTVKIHVAAVLQLLGVRSRHAIT